MKSPVLFAVAGILSCILIAGCGQTFEEAAFTAPADTYQVDSLNLRNGTSSGQIRGASITASFFQGAKISPLVGRGFLPEEYGQHRQVVVLSYRFWQRQFGGDPRVIGSSIELNGQTNTVVGIMPRGFDFPPHVDIWVPANK
jgi:hypothetical protein